MSPEFSYHSDLFGTMPDHSGYLAIYFSESRCDIAICSSSFVLVFLESFKKSEEQSKLDFMTQLIASKQSLFAKHFQEVNIGLHSNCFTILPNHEADTAHQTLDLLCGQGNAHENFVEPVHFLDADLHYRFSKDVLKVIRQSFEQQQPVNCLNFSLDLARKTPKYDQLLLIDDNHFDLIVKKEGHIYSANRHGFEAAEDVTYFSLLCFKDAGIDPQDGRVIVTGRCDKSNDIYSNLAEFIGRVDIKKINETVTIRSDFDQPQQYAEYALNLLHANY